MDESRVVRRVIAADNSCLFNAVGYVMEHNKQKAKELRKVIADAVKSNPELYSEAVLGKPNAEYCKWILDSQKWGGAIELAILSDHFGKEIAAYDIQTNRCDIYGQDKGYSERVMLIYDGLHYDAMALELFQGAPQDIDVTIFSKSDFPEQGARALVEEQHRAKKFTDTQNFTLRCGVCQAGVKGQKEAVDHAKATGHQNFVEFR